MPRNILNIFTPLTFLRLQSPGLKLFQWTIPGFLAVLSVFLYWQADTKPQLFVDKGIVISINGLLSILIAFYIAALAAVAAFPNPILDQTMKGRPPELHTTRGGHPHIELMTRRRFMAILFGYSSFLSIVIYALGLASLSAYGVSTSFNNDSNLAYFLVAIYSFILASLLSTTMLGLHYLIDRMHRD